MVGVTASGGEPLMQTKFLINLFFNLKKEGIHTAIDTSRNGRFNRRCKKTFISYRLSSA